MEPVGTISADLRGRHLVVAIPSMDGRLPLRMAAELLRLLPMLGTYGVRFSLHQVSSNSLINSARNQLVAAFMTEQTATDLLFLDSDIVIKAEDILRLMVMATEKELVAATYRKKEDKVAFHGRLLGERCEKTGLLRADRVPGGCTLIRRSVFPRMFKVFSDFKYDDEAKHSLGFDDQYLYDLFSIMVVEHRLIGEDIMFSLRFHSIGGGVWIDPTISLIHIGSKDYEGRLSDLLELSNGDQQHVAPDDV